MRAIVAAALGGVVLGVALGGALGKFQASFRHWTPEMEVNQAVAAQKEAAKKAKSDENGDDANAETAQADADPKSGPIAKVDETSFDFGILEKNAANEKGEHPFYIENVGTADMTLADGGKGCFCTEFEISKTTLKPGEKATVLFKWDGARSGGVFDQGVRVLTNDPKHRELYFIVRGLYTSPIIANPNELNFHNAPTSESTTRTFRLMGFERNDDGTPFPLEILGVEIPDPEHFSVELKKEDLSTLTEDDLKHNLFKRTANVFSGVATLKPGMTQGAFQEIVRIRTNSPKTPIVELTLHGQVSGGEVKISGRNYDAKDTGRLKIGAVSTQVTTEERVRLTILDKIPANAETVRVKSVRPDWLKVDFTYPDEELQKTSPIRLVEAKITLPAGSPQGAFMGPGQEQLGEIVFSIGATPETSKDVVLPVQFAVGP